MSLAQLPSSASSLPRRLVALNLDPTALEGISNAAFDRQVAPERQARIGPVIPQQLANCGNEGSSDFIHM
jgi:hypothetical protein